MLCAAWNRRSSEDHSNHRPNRPQSPQPASSCIVIGPQAFRRAADMLSRNPDLSVCLVESSWERVDAARARARAAGLDDRLAVHHASALQLARAS